MQVNSYYLQTEKDYANGVDEVDRLSIFKEHMACALLEAGHVSLIGIDIVFIPILHYGHYYVIAFNLKNAKVEVIDNIATEVGFNEKYEHRTQIMVCIRILKNCIFSLVLYINTNCYIYPAAINIFQLLDNDWTSYGIENAIMYTC